MVQPIRNGDVVKLIRPTHAHDQQGFTYIGVLVIMFVMLLALGAVSEVWHTVMQQEKEKELLFVGHQFRAAIAKYYLQSGKKYPSSLEVLVESDAQNAKKAHFLRKLYVDPITGDGQWGLVAGQNGGVAGVYSLSEDKPYKISGFTNADIKFEGADKYSDWKFVYMPTTERVLPAKGALANGVVQSKPRMN